MIIISTLIISTFLMKGTIDFLFILLATNFTVFATHAIVPLPVSFSTVTFFDIFRLFLPTIWYCYIIARKYNLLNHKTYIETTLHCINIYFLTCACFYFSLLICPIYYDSLSFLRFVHVIALLLPLRVYCHITN